MGNSELSHTRELPSQRLDRLRALLRENETVRTETLCSALSISPATARRDLEALEQSGEVRRVHGGAVWVKPQYREPLFDDKASQAQNEKKRIAREAAAYIAERDTIYLDGGSTVLELAGLLHHREDVTVVTNSLRAAWELGASGPRVILIGGELRRLSQTMVGPLTRLMMDELHLDKAFMGTLGFTLDQGMTTTDPGEAYTKELVIQRSREVVLLADSTKLGRDVFASAGGTESVDVLITDKGIHGEMRAELSDRGIRVVMV